MGMKFSFLFTLIAAAGLSAQTAAAEDEDFPTISVLSMAQSSALSGVAAGRAEPLAAVAARHLRPGTILQAGDFIIEGAASRAAEDLRKLIAGQEAKRAIYAGRPISASDIGPPTLIERNDLITLEFARGPLVITTEGRALDEGAAGDTIRIMNLSSKIVLSGVVISSNKAAAK